MPKYVIDSKYIKQALDTFYALIDGKVEGAPDTRYRSWEWCYEAFNEGRAEYNATEDDDKKEKIVDYLALHLGFYLASWGMYRGSSYLLQREYKAHKPVVRILLEDKYNSLWGYGVAKLDTDDKIKFSVAAKSSQNKLIFEEEVGLYWRIRKAYGGYDGNDDDNATDTLVTKILMGTMGCVPAFDRFLKIGIKWLKQQYNDDYSIISQTIESKAQNEGKTFFALEIFAGANKDALTIVGTSIQYPIMKCVDMFFWQVGYELDIMDNLQKSDSVATIEKMKKAAVNLGVCEENDDKATIINKIKERWGIENA